jgi:hypothetical protein
MKPKPLFLSFCVVAVAVATWFGSRALTVYGETPTTKNGTANQQNVMIEVSLPEEIQKILTTHVHRGRSREVLAGELFREDFTKDELAKLDSFFKDRSPNAAPATFEQIVHSSCGACNTGASKGYRLYIPMPGGGFYACATCNP